ncbi:MAG: glycosyltransferase family 2 protein [Butyrivibrio sp.]|nr:glycosyltransferase family 2 protein [Butyrivibrio sp.]
MKKGIVSIVLPVYNVEKYLNRCMESVVNQSYPYLEIIMVDDGSTDSSGKMCDDWAKKDKRVKVIHKKNAGLGLARNTGIENAMGEYICFFDSDDYIEHETIEHLYNAAQKTSAEIVTFGFKTVDRNEHVTKETIPLPPKEIYEGDEIINVFLPEMISFNPCTGKAYNLWMSAWASMFSMKLIIDNDWSFVSERKMISEDVYSLLILYANVRKVCVVSEALYNYCENDTNSLTRVFRKDRYEKQKIFIKGCMEICDQIGYPDEIRKRLNYQFIGNTLGAMKRIVISELDTKNRFLEIKKIVNDDVMQAIVSKLELEKESFARKVLFWSMKKKLSFVVYCLIFIQALKL